MTDNEFLVAMSDMLDTKLRTELKRELQPIKDDVHQLQKDMNQVKGEVHQLQDDVHQVKGEVHQLQDDVHQLQEDMHQMKGEVHQLQDDVHQLQEGLYQMKAVQESVVVPRLNNIEECYLSTYERYKKGVDRMDRAFDDIDLLKKTVTNHSIKLQKLA